MMNNDCTIDRGSFFSRVSIQAWSASALLHGVLVLTAVLWMPKLTIVLEQEPFRWEVSLVNSASEDTQRIEQMVAAAATSALSRMDQQQEKPIPPTKMSTAKTFREAPPPPRRMNPPATEQPKTQTAPSSQPTQETEQPIVKPEPQEVTRLEPRQPEPVATEMVKQEPTKEPTPEADPVSEPVTATYAPQPSVSIPHESVAEAAVPSVPTAEPSSVAPAAAEVSTPIAKAAPPTAPQTSGAKANHRWVGESLWRRVAELKRYPSAARLNSLEGQVIVRAVIEANGNLMDVQIRKSSGHDQLDEAALDVVRQACPLHMKQELEVAQVVIDLPISYSLRR